MLPGAFGSFLNFIGRKLFGLFQPGSSSGQLPPPKPLPIQVGELFPSWAALSTADDRVSWPIVESGKLCQTYLILADSACHYPFVFRHSVTWNGLTYASESVTSDRSITVQIVQRFDHSRYALCKLVSLAQSTRIERALNDCRSRGGRGCEHGRAFRSAAQVRRTRRPFKSCGG